MEVPGDHSKFGMLSDGSISFGLDPVSFVQGKIQKFGPVFSTRVLNKETVFVCSQKGMHDLMLAEGAEYNFGSGYHHILGTLYGEENLLLADGVEWRSLRNSLNVIFSKEATAKNVPRVHAHVDKFVEGLEDTERVDLYPLFRDLATDLTMMLFLDLDEQMGSQECTQMKQVARDHWRGLVTAPSSLSPQYRKAQRARDQLSDSIRRRLRGSEAFGPMQESGVPKSCMELLGEDQAVQQLLLLVSALVPKAIASVLTSLFSALAKPSSRADVDRCRVDRKYMLRYIQEVQRLWPPFFGGFRTCKHNTLVDGYDVKAGQPIIYAIHALNHDSEMFQDPTILDPSRWEDNDASGLRTWTYGGGARECLGRFLSTDIVAHVGEAFINRYDIVMDDTVPYKWIPIARPTKHSTVTLTRRQ